MEREETVKWWGRRFRLAGQASGQGRIKPAATARFVAGQADPRPALRAGRQAESLPHQRRSRSGDGPLKMQQLLSRDRQGAVGLNLSQLPGERLAIPCIALLVLLCTPLSLAAGYPPDADKEPTLEYQVKAAFLLNFTKFIEWPPAASADGPFTICVLGDNPFGGALDRMVEGETAGGRGLAVQKIDREQPAHCRIVFAGRSEKDLSAFLARLGPGTLTVGEDDSFLREGGMIAFVIDNRRVRFDVNLRAAANAGLRISSKLLNVARSVEK
jgi:hypothetical protein